MANVSPHQSITSLQIQSSDEAAVKLASETSAKHSQRPSSSLLMKAGDIENYEVMRKAAAALPKQSGTGQAA